MKTYLTNRFLVSTIAFILLLCAVLSLIVLPSVREIKLINKQVHEERVRLEKLYLKGQLQRHVRENYNKIINEIDFLDSLMLKENQELQYITNVEKFASEENLTLSIQIGESKRMPETPFSTLAFVFNVSGKWENILKWIDKVEALPYYTNIKEISISIREDTQSKIRSASATINADTYWLIN